MWFQARLYEVRPRTWSSSLLGVRRSRCLSLILRLKLWLDKSSGEVQSSREMGASTFSASIAGTITTVFGYDANGNQTAGLGRIFSFGVQPSGQHYSGPRAIGFDLDPDGQRFAQIAPEGTMQYFEAFGVRAELLASNRWTEYLSVASTMIGARLGCCETAKYVSV